MLNPEFVNYVNLMDFAISLQNLKSNQSQEERQQLEQTFNTKLDAALQEIHEHLKNQDRKIDLILSKLEENKQ